MKSKSEQTGGRVRKKMIEKRIVKFLAVCKDPHIHRLVIRRSPDGVIKAICNAALNVQRGDIELSEKQKAQLRRHRSVFKALVSRKVSIKRKRAVLQKGGFLPFLLPLIGAIAPAILGAILPKRD